MFEKVKTKKLPYKAEILPKIKIGKYILPCLTSSFKNQGLNYFVPEEGATILNNVISIPSNSDVYRAYFQSRNFTVLSDAYAIRWKSKETELSSKQYLFFVLCINKVTDLSIYSYKNKLGGWNVVQNKYIQLPTKNGEIDFEFMESFVAELEAQRVAELEAQRVAELEAYLLATGLKDYELTDKEKQAIDEIDEIEWGEYRLGDLFEVTSSKKILHANNLKIFDTKFEATYPYVVRKTKDNGVRGYIKESKEFLNTSNTLSFAQDTFTVFYQKERYFTGNNVKILKPKTDKFNEKIAIFFVNVFNFTLRYFTWGTGSTINTINLINIQLPTKNGEIDFKYMETLISAIQKLVIKDVVLYTDRKIQVTKQII